MTPSLEQAVILASTLPEDRQEVLAQALLDLALPTIE